MNLGGNHTLNREAIGGQRTYENLSVPCELFDTVHDNDGLAAATCRRIVKDPVMSTIDDFRHQG